MQIFSIQKQNNIFFITFNGKIPAKKVITSAAAITPIAATGLYLSEKNSDLYNQSVDEDKRLEEYLLNAVQTQERISKQKIAEDLGIDIGRCVRKLAKGSLLNGLWLQTNHAGKNREEIIDEAFIENKKRLEKINSDLWRIVTEAYENSTPITYSQVARQIGVTPSNCISRIKNNKKLFEIWNQIEHPRVTEESENINRQIADIILDAQKRGRTVSYKVIAQKLGLTKNAVSQRIHDYPQLEALISEGRYSKVSEESQDVDEKIAEVLKESIANNIRLRIVDIAEKIKKPFLTVKVKIMKVPTLAELWAKTPHRAGNRKPSQKTTEIDTKLKQLMEKYIQSNTPVTLKELSAKVDVPYNTSQARLEVNPELKETWQKVPRKNVGGCRDYVRSENESLINLMENYISQGIRVDGIQLSKETGMTLDKFRAKIKHYPEVKAVWQRLKDLDRAESDNVNKKIEKVLKQAIKDKTILSGRALQELVGTDRHACSQRIYKDENLYELWLQIKAIEQQKVIEKQNKIKEILENAIKENKKIRIYDIANKTGYSFSNCFERISHVPELQALWVQLDHSKVKEETKELTKEIKNILLDANKRGERLYINDIVEFTQNDYNIVRYKIHRSEELMKLWEENKKINYTYLKQIHSLKQNKMEDDDIRIELDLENDVFDKLITEYNNLSKILEIHKDKNISDEEYISWAILSKREYEQITNLIFEKMGYKAVTTRYMSDGGVDVIAEKDGKTAIIECIHNLTKKERAIEVLALEGVRAANNIDEAFLVTASGVHFNAENCVKNINNNNSGCFKIFNIEDMIKIAKENNIDINSINFNDFEDNNETMLGYDVSNWYFKKSDKLSDEERNKWLKLSQKEYEERIINYFKNKGYDVESITRTVGLNGFYILKKDKDAILINCGSRNLIPEIDDLRGLYGCKSVFGADKVVLIGSAGLSSSEKSYIDLINNQKNKKGTFRIISFDRIIELLENK